MIVFNTKLDLEEYITSMTSVRLSPGAIYMGLPCLFPSSGTLQIHAPDLGLASQWLGWLVVGAAALDDLDTSVKLGDISVGTAPSFSLKTVLRPSCCFSNNDGSWQSGRKCALHTWDHSVSWKSDRVVRTKRTRPLPANSLGFGEFQELNLGILGWVLVQPPTTQFRGIIG